MDEHLNRLTAPALVVPVSGRPGLDAAVRHGADKIVLNGRTGYDAKAARRDVNFGIVESASLADGIEYCLEHSVAVRLAMTGGFPVRRFAAILDLAAELAEMGVSEIELSDPGLAAAFKSELPDVSLVYGGGPVCNPATASIIARAGFGMLSVDSSVSCTDIGKLIEKSGMTVEMPLFGLRPIAWCRACMAGEYFDGTRSGRDDVVVYGDDDTNNELGSLGAKLHQAMKNKKK